MLSAACGCSTLISVALFDYPIREVVFLLDFCLLLDGALDSTEIKTVIVGNRMSALEIGILLRFLQALYNLCTPRLLGWSHFQNFVLQEGR